MNQNTPFRVRRPDSGRAKALDQTALTGNDRYQLERKILSQVKKTPRFLLRELFDFFQGRADCFPSNDRISEASGISSRNVRYLLRELEAKEIVRSIEDLTVRSQRRIVLLEHPHALAVLKALGSLPQWMEQFVEPKGATVAGPEPPRVAMVAGAGGQDLTDGGATVATEALNANLRTRNRPFPALRGIKMGGQA